MGCGGQGAVSSLLLVSVDVLPGDARARSFYAEWFKSFPGAMQYRAGTIGPRGAWHRDIGYYPTARSAINAATRAARRYYTTEIDRNG